MKHYVAVQLRSRLTAFSKTLQDVRHDATNVEALHDLRVASRRFSQAVRLFSEFLEPKHTQRMRKRLHALMEHSGAVRNCDVTSELLAAVELSQANALQELAHQREQLQARLERHLKRWHGERSPKHWRPWLRPRTPEGNPWDVRQSAADNARVVLPVMAHEYFEAGESAAQTRGAHELHQFRLLGKRFRYSLELFTDVYGPAAEVRLTELKKLQNLLGGINDCVVGLELIRGHAELEQALQELLESRRQEFFDYWPRFSKRSAALERWLKGAHHHGAVSTPAR